MYQAQHSILRENQRDHIAHLAHAKFTEQLYKRQVPLQDFQGTISLEDEDLLNLLQKYQYSCTGTFTLVDNKKHKEKIIEYLGKIVIKVKDISKGNRSFFFKKGDKEEDPLETSYDYDVFITTKMQ